jgi:hypothetical protein
MNPTKLLIGDRTIMHWSVPRIAGVEETPEWAFSVNPSNRRLSKLNLSFAGIYARYSFMRRFSTIIAAVEGIIGLHY